MKTYVKVLIGIILVLLLAFIWKLSTTKETSFNKITLSQDNYTLNSTSKKYLDTIVNIGLSELNMKYIVVWIKPINLNIKNTGDFNDLELKAYITGSGNQYMLYIIDTNRNESIKIISHELIHLVQYNTHQLITNSGTVLWLGNPVDIKTIQYIDRPWEIDALEKQGALQDKIESKLY